MFFYGTKISKLIEIYAIFKDFKNLEIFFSLIEYSSEFQIYFSWKP